MRAVLTALNEELKRLKTAGVRSVAVAPETIERLRAIVHARASGRPAEPSAAVPAETPVPAVAATAREVAAARKPEEPVLPPPPAVELPAGDKATRWAALRELVMSNPTCQAHLRPEKKLVLGVGGLDAKIMFVGEAPGAEEEVQGEPFVGPAGQLLNKMLSAMGLERGEVYIGNIMNWRPEMPLNASGVQFGNRPPTEAEMNFCLPFLRAQIAIVDPQLIVALGSTAAQGLLGFGSFRTLGEVRGKWREFAGRPLMVTYHPSYILRNQSNRSKRMIWEDLLQVMARANLPVTDKQRGYFLDR
jgi:DNA polymerase